MKRIPTISKFMTKSPVSIEAGACIREADALMGANGFRHLPVLREGKPIGILSDRDLKMARGLNGVDLDSTPVEDVASKPLYSVDPGANLADVVDAMFRKKIGSAVVVQDGKVVGIFTTMDALSALSKVLRS